MKQTFKYYLHDSYSQGEMREYLEEKGIILTEEAWANIGRPFYEVGFNCEIDDKGKITILGLAK